MKKLFLCWVSLLLCLHTIAQQPVTYQAGFMYGEGLKLPYRFLKPPENHNQKYPLIIFLHGAFEKGDDNERQLDIGGKFFLNDSIRNQYPAFVLFPQCADTDSWAYFENKIDFATGQATDWNFPFNKKPTRVTAALKKLIDSLVLKERLDPTRIYIAGYSQGGMGVLDMIARYPDTFAAGLSICGAGEPLTAKFFAGKVALWMFHGDKDDVVPVSFSRDYARRLSKLGAVVKYSEYSGIGHNSWAVALAEPGLMQWLFTQHK